MQQYAISKKATFFTLQYPALIRVWHWLTFLFMTASLVTVLLASTLFEVKRPNPAPNGQTPQIAQQQEVHHEQPGAQRRFDPSKLDPETRAAFMYRNKIWDAHKIIGFGLCFLLLSRVFIEVSRNKEDRLVTRINKAINIPVRNREDKKEKTHFLLVKRGYLVFYGLFILMACTGLIMAFEHTPLLEGIQRPARGVHQTIQYLIYTYILAHLIGVIRADLNKQKGIVSAMINGGA